MKSITKLKWLIALLFIAVNAQTISAQTKADIFDPTKPITWLGVDYSLTKFIGVANSKESGMIGNDEFRDVYTLGWNYLFVTEQKKYDVAKAVNRPTVIYATEVAININKALKKEFFDNNPGDFKLLTEADIVKAVKNYDFQNKDGIGMMFFVEGMSKGISSMGIWVTFVNMKTKTVLLTTYQTGKPGGFGFRNYWAKPLYTVLKDMESNFTKWK